MRRSCKLGCVGVNAPLEYLKSHALTNEKRNVLPSPTLLDEKYLLPQLQIHVSIY